VGPLLGLKNILWDSHWNVAVFDFYYGASASTNESNIHFFVCKTMGACLITMIMQIGTSASLNVENVC